MKVSHIDKHMVFRNCKAYIVKKKPDRSRAFFAPVKGIIHIYATSEAIFVRFNTFCTIGYTTTITMVFTTAVGNTTPATSDKNPPGRPIIK